MKLTDPLAKALWGRFKWRAQLLLSDSPPSLRHSLLVDLDAHVAEAMSREDARLAEFERLKGALERTGDPAQFLRPVLMKSQDHASSRSKPIRLVALALSAVAFAFPGIFFLLWGVGGALHPQGVGLFRLGPDEYQMRLLGFASNGSPLGAPWLALCAACFGIALLWWGWRQALRIWSALLLRRGSGD